MLLQAPGVAATAVDTFEPTRRRRSWSATTACAAGPATWTRTRSSRTCASSCRPTWCRPTSSSWTRHPDDPADKVDRRALPAPTCRRRRRPASTWPRASETEQVLADALAGTLGVDTVSVDSNFFDDLGANSLLLAKFSALVRKETSAAVAVHAGGVRQPHVRQLAALLGTLRPVPPDVAGRRRATVRAGEHGRLLDVRRRAAAGLRRRPPTSGLLLVPGSTWSSPRATTPLRSSRVRWLVGLATFPGACAAADPGQVAADRDVPEPARSRCGPARTSGSGWSRR